MREKDFFLIFLFPMLNPFFKGIRKNDFLSFHNIHFKFSHDETSLNDSCNFVML